MILIIIGIAAAWLAVSIPCALLFVRAMTLNEGNERAQRREQPVPQAADAHGYPTSAGVGGLSEGALLAAGAAEVAEHRVLGHADQAKRHVRPHVAGSHPYV